MINPKLLISITLLLSLQACSSQQIVGTTISVAKLPVDAATAVVGTVGGVVGGTAGGLVAGETGRRVGSIVGQSAARRAIP